MNEKLLAFANKSNVEQNNVDGKANDSEMRYKWLTNWASEHNVELNDRDKVDPDGTRYIYVVCPNDASHKDAAIIINPDGAVGFKCFHDSCSNLNWKAYRSFYDPDAYNNNGDTEESTDKEKKQSQADVLVGFLNEVELFHDELKEPHARITIKSHGEVWSCRSHTFKLWLRKRFYEKTGKTCNSDSINQALGVAEAKAIFDGSQKKLDLRCAERDGEFWYDLANPEWQAVKITKEGWSVVPAPIIFRHCTNTAPQVLPSIKGDISKLRPFVNVKSDINFNLIVVYLISCLIPDVPKVILPISGERGASKSTMLRILRKLVDPAQKELLTFPSDLNELGLILYKNYMPAFDNMSNLNERQSDMLCCASTGGGIVKRRLYTDDEEVILSFLRCVTLNGINQVAIKADLLDRSILLDLCRIDEDHRLSEKDFWANFEAARPAIFGGMLDILVNAINLKDQVKLKRLPRMADFCEWGFAIAEAMGWSGNAFLAAYYGNIDISTEEAIKNSPIAAAVVAFMKDRESWRGKSSALLCELNATAEEELIDTHAKSWPKAPNTLSRRLKQHKANFADVGILYQTETDKHTKTDTIILTTNRMGNSAPQAPQGMQEEHKASSLAGLEGFEECGDNDFCCGDTVWRTDSLTNMKKEDVTEIAVDAVSCGDEISSLLASSNEHS